MPNYPSANFTNNGEKLKNGEISLLQRSVQFFGECPFLINDKRIYSFQETDIISSWLSHRLSDIGIKQGDKVILYLEGGAEFVFSRFSLRKLGTVIIPLNNTLDDSEIQRIIDNVEPDWIIVSRKFFSILKKIIFTDFSERIIIIEEMLRDFIKFEVKGHQGLFETKQLELPTLTTDLNSNAAICYTSGTTGHPKGVVYTHQNILASGRWMAHVTDMQHNDVLLNAIPIYVSSNFNGHFIASLMQGTSIVLLNKFDPEDVLTKIETHKVTILHATGNMYVKLLNYKNIFDYNLTSIRVVTWSNLLPTVLQKQLVMAFPNAKILQLYGFAEGGPVGTSISLEDLIKRPNSCGKIDPDFACFRVVGKKGNDVPIGEIGEIIYQSPGLMRTYYRNPKATKKAIRDGWYYTGDLGRLDQDNFLYFVGRKKEFINIGKEKVHPVEIEEVLFKHPAVLDVAVVNAPHPTLGQEIKAFVVVKEGVRVNSDELIDFCAKQNLKSYKIPSKIEFRSSFPKNSMGKTLKNKLI